MENINELLKLFSQMKNVEILVLTNFIIFVKEYEELLKKGKLNLNVSIDSSDEKLYKLIHQSDKFNIVVKNLKKAVKFAKDKQQVKIKYIILENINDNTKTIDKFIDLALKLKVGKLQFDFDRSEININKEIPEHILKLYLYAKNKGKEKGFFVDLDPRSEAMYKSKIYI